MLIVRIISNTITNSKYIFKIDVDKYTATKNAVDNLSWYVHIRYLCFFRSMYEASCWKSILPNPRARGKQNLESGHDEENHTYTSKKYTYFQCHCIECGQKKVWLFFLSRVLHTFNISRGSVIRLKKDGMIKYFISIYLHTVNIRATVNIHMIT